MHKITLKSFGRFRDLSETITLEVAVLTAHHIKQALRDSLKEPYKSLVDDSVLATAHKILNDRETVAQEESLSILPPVCGG